MRQRIKFAQAIAHDPEIIILDEPLSGLDPLGKRKLIRLIKDYRDQGRTILVSSHVLPEIEAMTSRIILIHQGKILAQGDIHYIRDLIETPSARHLDQVRRSARPGRPVRDRALRPEARASGRTASGLVVETHNRDAFFGRLNAVILESGRPDRGDHLARRQPPGGVRLPGGEMTC